MARDLAQRVEQNAVATRDSSGTKKSLQQQVREMESQFALAMPKGAEAAQLVRDALTAIRSNPKLAECEATSVLGALMTCAQLGLRPGVLGHAWILPFYSTKNRRSEAQLVIGYQGLVELAHRSGRIVSLIARTVYENDHFDIDYGLDDRLVHRPTLKGAKGDPIGYYAIAKFTTGGHAFIFVSHDEMIVYKNRYAMARNREGVVFGPWADNFEGMAHKTCVRQLAKWMPKSTDFANAIEVDDSVRVDMSPTADAIQVSRVEHETIDGQIVDTGTGEVIDEAAGLTQADIDAMNADTNADLPVEDPPSGLFGGE
jgi:recombination protein RecT